MQVNKRRSVQMTDETAVQEYYNRWASVYDWMWKRYTTKSLSVLKRWMKAAPGRTLLDVGCGTGAFEQMLAEDYPGLEMVGVDISENMLTIAREKLASHPNVSFMQATASTLPFDDSRFDRVVSASALHYFEDPSAALAEMRRVLTPDGRLIIVDWCRDYLACQIYDRVLSRFDPAYQKCYTQRELHDLLTGAGFKPVRATRFRFDMVWGLMVTGAV